MPRGLLRRLRYYSRAGVRNRGAFIVELIDLIYVGHQVNDLTSYDSVKQRQAFFCFRKGRENLFFFLFLLGVFFFFPLCPSCRKCVQHPFRLLFLTLFSPIFKNSIKKPKTGQIFFV